MTLAMLQLPLHSLQYQSIINHQREGVRPLTQDKRDQHQQRETQDDGTTNADCRMVHNTKHYQHYNNKCEEMCMINTR